MQRILLQFKIFNIPDKQYILSSALFIPISSVLFVMAKHKTEYITSENI